MIKAGTTAFDLIMRYARKRLAAPNAEGIMEVMSNKQAMDFVKDLVNEFNRFGVPESAITVVDDVAKFANQIVDIKQQRLMQAFKEQMTPKKSADIIELQTGKKIDQSKGIMGGRQVDQTDDEATKALQDKLAKDKGYQKYRGETEEQIRERFKKQNKEAIERFKKNMDDLEDKATGGRVGLKDGPEKPSRRKFLKIAGGLAALPIIGKFFKAAKVASKVPQVVTTAPVPGKPAWFDSLVNKVIREGDDVTKRFATKEREIVHTKKIDEDSTVTVTQDLDEGIVRVEYDSADNVFEDTVQLQYKKPLPDEVNPNPKAEFTTAESGPVGRAQGPDDYDIEIDEVGGTSIKDLSSDLSKLKQYATDKKPTLKEFVQNKKRRDKAARISDDPQAQMDDVIARQGEMLDDQDFASGGRVGLLSGGGVLRVILQNLAKRYGKKPSELLAVTNYKSLPVEVRKFLSKEQFEAIKKDMQEMRVEQFQNIRDMIENRQQFDKSREALKKMGLDISDTVLQAETKAPVPGGTIPDDLLMMEQIIKNLQMKDRKLNASGGLAGMLGE